MGAQASIPLWLPGNSYGLRAYERPQEHLLPLALLCWQSSWKVKVRGSTEMKGKDNPNPSPILTFNILSILTFDNFAWPILGG